MTMLMLMGLIVCVYDGSGDNVKIACCEVFIDAIIFSINLINHNKIEQHFLHKCLCVCVW